MTGLSAQKDVIIEVASIETDWDLSQIGPEYESGVKHSLDVIQPLLDANSWLDDQPKYKAKMIDVSLAGKPVDDVEQEILDTLPPIEVQVYLAGNSIHCDRQFIDKYMPRLSARLHYRMLDVSSFKLWLAASGRVEPFEKANHHRALQDIRESIAELKYYSQNILPK